MSKGVRVRISPWGPFSQNGETVAALALKAGVLGRESSNLSSEIFSGLSKTLGNGWRNGGIGIPYNALMVQRLFVPELTGAARCRWRWHWTFKSFFEDKHPTHYFSV